MHSRQLAALVLARSPEIGQVRCETVGYEFTPSVERRHLLGGLVPSRSAQGAELLVYRLYRSGRAMGTVFTVVCSRELADEAIGRFRALAEPGYQPPAAPGQCVLDGEPGRVWIGGVLVTVMPGLLTSYDLPLEAKGLQNRDRTVIEAGALRTAVRAMLATSQDEQIIDRFARHALAGGETAGTGAVLRRHLRDLPASRLAPVGPRLSLPAQTCYTTCGNEERSATRASICCWRTRKTRRCSGCVAGRLPGCWCAT